MKLNQDVFKEYVSQLRMYLFDDQTLEEIMRGIVTNHRKKRWFAMYLLQSEEIFRDFYAKRQDFAGLERLFNQVISALYYETEKTTVKQDFVSLLELAPELISEPVERWETRETDKDIKTFVWWAKKRELNAP